MGIIGWFKQIFRSPAPAAHYRTNEAELVRSRETPKSAMFQILRYFSITSFLVIAVVALATIVLVAFYRQLTVTELIELGQSRNVALTQAFANSIWPRFAPYLTSVVQTEGNDLRARPETAQIRGAVIALMHDLPVLKVKIYNLDGLTVFSTDETEIGMVELSNEGFFAAARAGKVTSDVTHRGRINAFDGELQDRDVLESYLPLRQGDGPVEAVFELYSDVTGLLHRVDQVQRNLLVGLIVAFGLIYGGLFLIVRRGDTILKKQYADIVRGRESVKAKNEELNREITERKQVEAALLLAKQEAERANHAKSKFFAVASHDLRQPLYAMSLFLPLLSKRVTARGSREIIDAIKNSCDAMGQLLDALLDLSKLDAGIVQPELKPVAAGALIKRLGTEFAPQAQDQGLELRVMPAELSVTTDPTLLSSILRNLLSNAFRYTLKGRVLFGARRRGSRLRFEVWDTGVGIAEDQIEDIFQEFYQVGNPERDRTQGLGLGLAVVDRLSTLLGHAVDVRSVPGKGSMFAIEVPMTQEEVGDAIEAHSAAGQVDEGLSGVVVALIEDEAEVLTGTQMTLEDWGCRVIGAETIDAALAKIAESKRRPDVIMADYRLRGEETGIMAIECIRRFVGKPIPALIITGDTDSGRLREAAEKGHALVHKPVQSDKLYRLIAAEIRGAPEPAEAEPV